MRVLLTGASGFIAGHTIVALLAAGHVVRGTVRDMAKAEAVRIALAGAGSDTSRLSFAACSLEADEGWDEAIAGCDAVVHMASPFPATEPANPDSLLKPAIEGTRRVLRFAHEEGATRVVLTSSLAAVVYGLKPGEAPPFDERRWTDPEGSDVGSYVRSKTLAERAAWDYVAGAGAGLRLTVINPGLVYGPLLSASHGTSVGLVRRMMVGGIPAAPRLTFNVVDVRDVASLHALALGSEDAIGQRYVCSAGSLGFVEMGRALRSAFPRKARRAPTRQLPDALVRLMARFDPSLAPVLNELGKDRTASFEKARTQLDWSPRPPREALLASAQSLIDLGLV